MKSNVPYNVSAIFGWCSVLFMALTINNKTLFLIGVILWAVSVILQLIFWNKRS